MIYMNNAATSYPKPECVAHAVARAIREAPGAANRAALGMAEEAVTCRRKLADLLGVPDESRVVCLSNSTMALNVALLGFPWKRSDVVITTEAEHNSVLRPLYRLKQKGVLDYHMLPVERDGRVSCKVWEDALRKYRPRMAVATHASNVTGAIYPIEEMAKSAKDAGCTILLDASQTMGLVPVRPDEWGVDLVAFTGHKYMLGPQGTGGLYVSNNIDLEPVVTGGTGIFSDEDEMPKDMPLHLEAGTPNEPSFEGLKAAILWQEAHPPCLESILDDVRDIETKLLQWGYDVVQVTGARTPVLAFASPVYEPEEIGEILYGSYGIVCRTGLHCAPKILPGLGMGPKGTVRISLSRFTTREEIEVLLEALEEIGKDHE